MLSIVNAAIACLPDPSWKIRELWGCRVEPNGDGGPYARNVTPIVDNNAAARQVMLAMKLYNPTLFCVIYGSQQAGGTAAAKAPMHGGCSNVSPDDIVPHPAKDLIHDIGQESEENGEMWRPYPRSFWKTKPYFQQLKWKLQKMIVRQQQYHQVIRNSYLIHIADYKQSPVADEDMAWLRKHNHIVNSPAAGSFTNRKGTSSRPAANKSLWGRNALAGLLFKDLQYGCEFFWHFGGWTDGWQFGVFWSGFVSVFGVLFVLLLHH